MDAQACKKQENKRMYSITSDAKKYLIEITLNTDNIFENCTSTEKAKQIILTSILTEQSKQIDQT